MNLDKNRQDLEPVKTHQVAMPQAQTHPVATQLKCRRTLHK